MTRRTNTVADLRGFPRVTVNVNFNQTASSRALDCRGSFHYSRCSGVDRMFSIMPFRPMAAGLQVRAMGWRRNRSSRIIILKLCVSDAKMLKSPVHDADVKRGVGKSIAVTVKPGALRKWRRALNPLGEHPSNPDTRERSVRYHRCRQLSIETGKRHMGRGCLTFNGIWSTAGRNCQSETYIADAAAIIIHRLVSAFAAKADDRASDKALALALYHDFGRIVR